LKIRNAFAFVHVGPTLELLDPASVKVLKRVHDGALAGSVLADNDQVLTGYRQIDAANATKVANSNGINRGDHRFFPL
jgi:hypothetical protein